MSVPKRYTVLQNTAWLSWNTILSWNTFSLSWDTAVLEQAEVVQDTGGVLGQQMVFCKTTSCISCFQSACAAFGPKMPPMVGEYL